MLTASMGSPDGSNDAPRLLPELALPPYAYVSGHFPHPIRDPAGHMAGHTLVRPLPPDPDRWRECHDYLRGLDLFNCGYYWEAHEVWEGLWHAVGRAGLLGDFFKGLIKLAAAGVKARERRPEGTKRHARRAAELFTRTVARLAGATANRGETQLMGLGARQLAEVAAMVAREPPRLENAQPLPPVEIVFDFRLLPR